MTTVPITEEDESMPVPPPAKGYNLDFLDNLDDPNFNPFATKTNIVDDVAKTTPDKVVSLPLPTTSDDRATKTPQKDDIIMRQATPKKSSNLATTTTTDDDAVHSSSEVVNESKSPQQQPPQQTE